MPAPSPVFPSTSTAPLCHTAFKACIPNSTTCLDFFPSVEATNPTPQASCSSLGLYTFPFINFFKFFLYIIKFLVSLTLSYQEIYISYNNVLILLK